MDTDSEYTMSRNFALISSYVLCLNPDYRSAIKCYNINLLSIKCKNICFVIDHNTLTSIETVYKKINLFRFVFLFCSGIFTKSL
jgi:hypothetical protein